MMLQHAHSALDPASPGAASVGRLYDYFLVVSAVVWIVVVATTIWAVRRRRADTLEITEAGDARARRAVFTAATVTVAILFVTLVYDLAVGKPLATRPVTGSPISIKLTGHQWWWDVVYEDSVPQQQVRTANEIHVPIGRPIIVKLRSTDVIHSFWIPNLVGKKDLIPGHHNEIWFTVSKPGVYRAPCAEFCGLQHAKMALNVVAEAPADFERWLAGQRAPGATPTDSTTSRGRFTFEAGSCAMCHNVTGTSASATVGPDLTHVGSRLSIAAGTLPNESQHLARWIVNPQVIKAGVLMPPNGLPSQDLVALVAYLRSLK